MEVCAVNYQLIATLNGEVESLQGSPLFSCYDYANLDRAYSGLVLQMLLLLFTMYQED